MQLNSKQDASANRLHDSRSSHDLAQSRHLPKARSGADENAVGALARAARGDSGCRVTVAIFENSGHVVGFSSTPLANSPSAARHLVTDVDESGELIVLLNVAAIDIDERRRKQAAGQPVGGPTGSATADQFAAGKAENMADLLSSPLFAGGELVGILSIRGPASAPIADADVSAVSELAADVSHELDQLCEKDDGALESRSVFCNLATNGFFLDRLSHLASRLNLPPECVAVLAVECGDDARSSPRIGGALVLSCDALQGWSGDPDWRATRAAVACFPECRFFVGIPPRSNACL